MSVKTTPSSQVIAALGREDLFYMVPVVTVSISYMHLAYAVRQAMPGRERASQDDLAKLIWRQLVEP